MGDSTTILGIDPGSRITGWGILRLVDGKVQHVNNGIIQPLSGSLGERLHTIYEKLAGVIRDYQPTQGAIEEVFVAKNMRSALLLGHARGTAMLALTHAGIPFQEYAPREIKLAITGFGAATKPQMQKMTMMVLKLPEVAAEDAADALAVALCYAHSFRLQEKIK